ncbi:hypothetical protein ACO2Q2_17450 [Dyella sp. KRB-257]|uniref:hypothetical protein n=1 Tax=Dyella sp. KRB-257 TaxID=3400915 RepID=UPI003C069732
MSGLSDLIDCDLTDAERLALCAELKRLNRVSPPDPAERGGLVPSPFESVEHAGFGDHAEVTA